MQEKFKLAFLYRFLEKKVPNQFYKNFINLESDSILAYIQYFVIISLDTELYSEQWTSIYNEKLFEQRII